MYKTPSTKQSLPLPSLASQKSERKLPVSKFELYGSVKIGNKPSLPINKLTKKIEINI